MSKKILILTLNLSIVCTRLKFHCYLTIWIEFQMELGYEFISIHSLGHAISWPKQTKLQKENNRPFIVGIPLDNDFVIMIQIFLNVHSMRKYYQTEHHNKKMLNEIFLWVNDYVVSSSPKYPSGNISLRCSKFHLKFYHHEKCITH